MKATGADHSIESSRSVIASFAYRGRQHDVRITGRGTSVLGSSQGDHVTAYGLVKRGIVNIIKNLTDEELSSQEYLTEVRGIRENLYEYVSALATLDPAQRQGFYNGVTELLEEYNHHRVPKAKIKEFEALADRLPEGPRELMQESIQLHHDSNGRLILDKLEKISELVLTFANHLPGSSFFRIKGAFESPAGDEEPALKILDQLQTDARAGKEPTVAVVAAQLNSLIFYPFIGDPSVLAAQAAKTAAKGSARSLPRDDSLGNLVFVLARHVHIARHVYPELFTPDGLKQDVIRLFVAQHHRDAGWSGCCDVGALIEAVIFKADELSLEQERFSLQNYDSFAEAASSEGELERDREMDFGSGSDNESGGAMHMDEEHHDGATVMPSAADALPSPPSLTSADVGGTSFAAGVAQQFGEKEIKPHSEETGYEAEREHGMRWGKS